MRSSVRVLAGLAGLLTKDKVHVPRVPSHPIERKEEVEQLSKRQIARLKGRSARKNRGRNRKVQDTALYSMLRR